LGRGTSVAAFIFLGGRFHFKQVKCDALATDWNLGQEAPDLPVESVLVHSEVGRGVTQPDEARP